MTDKDLYRPGLPNPGSHGSQSGTTGKGTGAETGKGAIESEIMTEKNGK